MVRLPDVRLHYRGEEPRLKPPAPSAEGIWHAWQLSFDGRPWRTLKHTDGPHEYDPTEWATATVTGSSGYDVTGWHHIADEHHGAGLQAELTIR